MRCLVYLVPFNHHVYMRKHTPISALQEVEQLLTTTVSAVSAADVAAQTLGADTKTRQDLTKGLFWGALILGAVYQVTRD